MNPSRVKSDIRITLIPEDWYSGFLKLNPEMICATSPNRTHSQLEGMSKWGLFGRNRRQGLLLPDLLGADELGLLLGDALQQDVSGLHIRIG